MLKPLVVSILCHKCPYILSYIMVRVLGNCTIPWAHFSPNEEKWRWPQASCFLNFLNPRHLPCPALENLVLAPYWASDFEQVSKGCAVCGAGIFQGGDRKGLDALDCSHLLACSERRSLVYFSKTMAALQIHGLPSVKGNPTVLMKRQDIQSPAKQTVLWAPKHTDKLCNKESTHNPVCHHRPDSALLHPASQRTCPTPHLPALSPTSPLLLPSPGVCTRQSLPWKRQTLLATSPYLFWQNSTSKKLSGFFICDTNSKISQDLDSALLSPGAPPSASFLVCVTSKRTGREPPEAMVSPKHTDTGPARCMGLGWK